MEIGNVGCKVDPQALTIMALEVGGYTFCHYKVDRVILITGDPRPKCPFLRIIRWIVGTVDFNRDPRPIPGRDRKFAGNKRDFEGCGCGNLGCVHCRDYIGLGGLRQYVSIFSSNIICQYLLYLQNSYL